jgi:aspartyl-tRNA(Asn)/glutamyl-tRNA(Gln) amidotransferase subunit C
MSLITIDEVKKLAHLSRLRITEEEAQKYVVELGVILEYVTILDSVQTKDAKPTNQVTGLVNVTRADALEDYDTDQNALLKNAPNIELKMFKVKRMVG